VPPLRGDVTEAVVTRWLTAHSPSVFKEGEPLVELSSGDIIRAPRCGYLMECEPVGKTVKVGDKLAVIGTAVINVSGIGLDTVISGNDLDTHMPLHVTPAKQVRGIDPEFFRLPHFDPNVAAQFAIRPGLNVITDTGPPTVVLGKSRYR
jgi:hypothetical protein